LVKTSCAPSKSDQQKVPPAVRYRVYFPVLKRIGIRPGKLITKNPREWVKLILRSNLGKKERGGIIPPLLLE